MTVTETLPPNEFLLKFMLERRMPEPYRPSKEVVHTHNAGALFQEFLKRMDERAKLEPAASIACATSASAKHAPCSPACRMKTWTPPGPIKRRPPRTKSIRGRLKIARQSCQRETVATRARLHSRA